MNDPLRACGTTLLAAIALHGGAPAWAQTQTPSPVKPATGLEAVDAAYRRDLDGLQRRRLADLDALAARSTGAEAEAEALALFRLALDGGLTAEALPAADRCLAAPTPTAEVRGLAALVAASARAARGEDDQALAALGKFLDAEARPDAAGPPQALGVGEALLRRLTREGRYGLAARACGMIPGRSKAPGVAEHFEARRRLLSLVGQPAPAFQAVDVDGRPVTLGDYKGKVVLLNFWATWCPPCLDEFAGLNALEAKYRGRGLEVVGVNVDARHEDARELKAVRPVVRHVLIEYDVAWANVLNDPAAGGDVARTYGVEALPADVLIGRDGKVVAVELGDAGRDAAVARALGEPPR